MSEVVEIMARVRALRENEDRNFLVAAALCATARAQIKALRTERGLTQYDLADAVGCSHHQISRLERGDTKITLEWIGDLAQAMRCRPKDILFP